MCFNNDSSTSLVWDLQKDKVEYKTDPSEGHVDGKCPVMVQKETSDKGMVDEPCGEEVTKGYADFCK